MCLDIDTYSEDMKHLSCLCSGLSHISTNVPDIFTDMLLQTEGESEANIPV